MDGSGDEDGFLYSNGTWTTLEDPAAANGPSGGTFADGINASGQIVGSYIDNSGNANGFLYSHGTWTTLDDPSAVNGTFANGINASGQIIGSYTDGSGNENGFLYSNGTWTTLDDPSAVETTAYAINSAGQIVGSYIDGSGYTNGFLYSNGTWTTLDYPSAASTTAYGINASGEIVGTYTDSSGNVYGFLYNNGVWTTINDPSGTTGTSPFGINDAGMIVESDNGGTSFVGTLEISLTEVANHFFLYNNGSGPELKYAGADVVAGEFGAWVPIAAAQTASGYEVAWKEAGINEYTVWNTDNNGNFASDTLGAVAGNSYVLESLEPSFGQDLNGDGTIGLTTRVIKTDGSTSLTGVANEYFLDNSGGSDPALQYHGSDVTSGEFGAWVPIGAVQTASGYDIAWEIPGANEYTVWTTDSNGNYVSDTIGVVAGNSYALESLAPIFGQDLNGGGVTGVPTVIQTDTSAFGSTSLTKVWYNYFLDNSSGSGPELQLSGADVVAGEFGGWVPIGAVQTASGYDIAWEIPGANEYTVWTTDSNGNYVSDTIGVVAGNSYALESLEATFGQDLNGDRVIGPLIVAGETLEIDSPYAGPLTFGGSTGTLQLDTPSSFTGTVAGLTGQDKLDLRFLNPATVQTPTYVGNSSGGTLTVTDGTHTANIALLGNYLASTFVTSSDGHGGTAIVDPVLTSSNQMILAQPQHA